MKDHDLALSPAGKRSQQDRNMPLSWSNSWAQLGSNQRPLACKASALPLSYAPWPRAQGSPGASSAATGASVPAAGRLPEVTFERITPSAGKLADSGGSAGPAEDPRERQLDLLGQTWRLPEVRFRTRLAFARRARARRARARRTRAWRNGTRAGSTCGHAGHRARTATGAAGVPDVTAVAALDLAQPAHQVRAQAHRAPVEFRHPVR